MRLSNDEGYLDILETHGASVADLISFLRQHKLLAVEQIGEGLEVEYLVVEDDNEVPYPFFDENGDKLAPPKGSEILVKVWIHCGESDVVEVFTGNGVKYPYIESDEVIVDQEYIDHLISILEIL